MNLLSKTKYLLFVPLFLLLCWFVLFGWFLVIREAPLTYWGYSQLSHFKWNPVFHSFFLYTFAKPFSALKPQKSGLYYMPYPKSAIPVTGKNYLDQSIYEIYGKITNINWSDNGFDLDLVSDSGRKETFRFDFKTSTFTVSEETGSKEFFYVKKKYIMNDREALKLGDMVRCRFRSPLGIDSYRSGQDPTVGRELVYVMQLMPDWLKY